MTKTLTIFGILIFFIACGDRNGKVKEGIDAFTEQDIAEQEIKKLADKYNALQGWDTLGFLRFN